MGALSLLPADIYMVQRCGVQLVGVGRGAVNRRTTARTGRIKKGVKGQVKAPAVDLLKPEPSQSAQKKTIPGHNKYANI